MDVGFLLALYEGSSGSPASPNDAEIYAQTVGVTSSPVFADGSFVISNATPMTQNTHPEMCALGPDMTILSCRSGHGAQEELLEQIRAHAGL